MTKKTEYLSFLKRHRFSQWLPTSLNEKPDNVLWYFPNLMGYHRIPLLLLSGLFIQHYPIIFTILFTANHLIDAFDGLSARCLDQSSRFGQVLDYMLDRVSLMCLCVFLTMIYPHLAIFFALIVGLDITSHIARLYSLVFTGSQTHKDYSEDVPLLRTYYSSRTFLTILCGSYDLFLGTIYWFHFYPVHAILPLFLFFLPLFVLKTVIHVLQLMSAMKKIAAIDNGQTPIQ